MCRMILIVVALLVGCDTSTRRRDGSSPDAHRQMDLSVDMMPNGDGSIDAEVPLDSGVRPDAAGPTTQTTPETECDGEDNDDDGSIDEGATNVCGGCGGLPPEGCQLWTINFSQVGQTPLNTNRLVSMSANVVGISFFETMNAQCQSTRFRLIATPEQHLGVVSVTNDDTTLVLRPSFDPDMQRMSYTPDAESENGAEFVVDDGAQLNVESTGSEDFAALDVRTTMPALPELEDSNALEDLVRFMRNETDVVPDLRWSEDEDLNTELKLYVGASKLVFRRVSFYQAIEHLVFEATLADDGRFSLPDEFVGSGLSGSSMWAYLRRQATQRFVFGPHALNLVAAKRVEARQGGGQALGDTPPFQITYPSPNDRSIDETEPFAVRWSDLPDGPGPLRVTLSYRDSDIGQQTVLECVVADPSLGEMVFPDDVLADLPRGPGEFKQITLRWGTEELLLPQPDQGYLSRAISVVLNLTEQ